MKKTVVGVAFSVVLLAAPRISVAEEIYSEGAPKLDGVVGQQELREAKYLPGLVKELSPAVVNISVESLVTDDPAQPEVFPFFRRDQDRPFRSVGSGFILSKDGYIVTANHVIEQSERTIVRLLDDKTDYPATVIGRDPKTDLALMKIVPQKDLETVFLGDSDAVEVGEWVVAIGNQFHLGQTVTAGIISAKSRRVPSRAGSPYDSFIQTDASINPGSSGGPLFNLRGQVIGINTAIFSPARAQMGGTGFNIGIGFAVPVNTLKLIINQLKDDGKVTRGLLGVKIQNVDESIKSILKLPSAQGALVADVIDGTPASAAGFKRKDVITAFHGQPIRDFDDLPMLVANTKVGTTVVVEILRDSQPRKLSVKIEEIQVSETAAKTEAAEKPNEIGVIFEEVNEAFARALEMKSVYGVLVTAVQPGSVAERAGLAKGDVIEEIGNVLVKDANSFSKLVKGLPKGQPVLMVIRRKDGTRILTLQLK